MWLNKKTTCDEFWAPASHTWISIHAMLVDKTPIFKSFQHGYLRIDVVFNEMLKQFFVMISEYVFYETKHVDRRIWKILKPMLTPGCWKRTKQLPDPRVTNQFCSRFCYYLLAHFNQLTNFSNFILCHVVWLSVKRLSQEAIQRHYNSKWLAIWLIRFQSIG